VREYERTSTTVLDAYVGPVLNRYLERLHERLKEENFNGELLVMQSNGGVHRWDTAIKRPVGSIHSGPAAAFPASLFFANVLDAQDVLSVDMGGTSFDVGLVKDRKIKPTTDGRVGHQRNATPMVDVHAIGTGGGSIAWIDPNGILRVGPQSAGSVPGPACYDKGGTAPTVTDANLILGYLNPENFLGGRMTINFAAAAKALKTLAQQLGVQIIEVAEAIYNVVNENMINAINLAAIRRGYNPQHFLLIVGGGTGATHAVGLANKLKISHILVPKQSPVYCAFGLLLSDLKHNYVRSYITPLNQADFSELNGIFEEMECRGKQTLEREGILPQDVLFHRSADMRYIGQYKEIAIDLPAENLSSTDVHRIEKSFSERHNQLFTFCDQNRGLELLTLKVEAIGKVPRVSLHENLTNEVDSSRALKGTRDVYFTEVKGFLDTKIYDGDLLKPGNVIEGPAIVEEIALTLVIPPITRFKVDGYGNYLSD
jgi:N-methylhydantoinase A